MFDPITLAGIVAKTVVSYGLKKGLDAIVNKKNKKKFEKKLIDVINITIEEFSKVNAIPESNGKSPFYQSQIILEELLKHRFFCKSGYKTDDEKILSEFKNNNKFIVPEKEQIHDFLNIFEQNINEDDELKKLAIEENYQEEIFTISDNVYELINLLRKFINPEGSGNSYPKELTEWVRISKDDIVGREKDLQDLRESLMQNHDTALINGMGGIGKTTLAAVYLTEFYDEYDHIVWLTIENSLEEAIIANKSLIKNLKIAEEELSEPLISCLNKLRTLQSDKPKLLVIDNAHENLAEHYNKLPKAPGWHLLVTSRKHIDHFKIINLDFLPEDEAIELFKKYHNDFSTEEIQTIVKGVELHTLTIEILAKSAQRNHWEYDTVKSAFAQDAKAGIKVKHNVDKIDRIKSYITSIFDISGLTEHEIYLLKQFTALPNQWIDYEFLSRLLDKDKLDWSDEFGGMLENVCDQGFVLKDDKADSYKMHPVLVEALIPRLGITIEDLKLLTERVSGLLYIDQSKDNPIDKFHFIPFGEALLKQIIDDSSDITSNLKSNLALVYIEMGEFENARELLEQALKTGKENHGDKHPYIATIQSNLATVYKDLGKFEKARELLIQALKTDVENYGDKHPVVTTRQSILALVYLDLGEFEKARDMLEQALQTDIENYGDKHPSVARRQSNLAVVYKNLGEFEKARDLLEQSLQTDIENYGNKHPSVTKRQSNLAVVYNNLGEYEKARELLEQALQTDIENYGDKHPSVARIQSNLAVVYLALRDLEKAKDLIERALQSNIENYGDKHHLVAISQSNLATVYKDLGEYEKARDLWKKAYDIFKVSHGEQHPNTKTVKEFLDKYGR